MTKAAHRQLAKQLFNHTWKLLDQKRRTVAEDDAMVHAAHASRHHWSFAGTEMHLARGEWQLSRVYAVLGRQESAQYHAERCLAMCRKHHLGAFDLAFAYEAMARASLVARRSGDARRYLRLARAAGAKIADRADRAHFERELATVKPGGAG